MLKDLIQALSYDPDTGDFHWKISPKPGIKAGDLAGSINTDGYRQIGFKKKNYLAHRVAFVFMTGSWPVNQGDHENGVRDDNRWSNLRDVTSPVNTQNQRKARKSSKTGTLGVSKQGEKYRADISISGKSVYLGLFPSEEQASQAYVNAKRTMHEGNTL